MKVAVMTDSTAYIPKDMREAYGIHMVPLSVNFGEETFQEEVDLTTTFFYQKLKEEKELPTTSQPAIGLITEKLEELSKDYDAVISVHLSSGISGTYQAVVSAGDMVEGIEMFAFDSEISCMAQGFYALEAAEMAKENKTAEEIMERLNEMKKTMHGYFMVDELTNLHRGGRLNGAQALVGSLLQVKPVLHFVDKVIVPFEKIRTRKKALNRILGMLEDDAKEDKVAKVVFIHANDEQAAIDIRDSFQEKYPNTEALISYFGPVIGTHVGEGAIGVCWYYK
ncbi:DegV family protein [Ornithinibacillus xuwenensis]|uniref:DegV family protein n=1 Tax=Ornithinibacillus xuwenensis TaxID=3144668 RepID=A0ABU9XKA6_9BACI